MRTRDFLVPSREGIFCLLRREKCSSYCRGNFFPAVGCYISLFLLFPYFPYFPINLQENYLKIPGWPQERRAIKFDHWEKNLAPFVKLQVSKSVKILVNQSYFYREK